MDSKVKIMTINAEPTSPGWRLVRNEEKLVIYTSNKLGISLTLTKYNTCWYIEQIEISSGMMAVIGQDTSKSGAIIKAKDFMKLHPMPSDEVLLKEMRKKSPKKLFGVSKANSRLLKGY